MARDNIDRARKSYRAASLLRQQVQSSFDRSPTVEWGRLLLDVEEIEAMARLCVEQATLEAGSDVERGGILRPPRSPCSQSKFLH